jgi:hypothetical protein
VVPAGADPEEDTVAVLPEDRRDDGDIRQVRAAVEGRVQHEGVARARCRRLVQPRDGAHRVGHGAEMHRHMGRVGHEIAPGIEERAGEIEPFLDVHGIGRVLQRRAHLFGDVHEEVVEHLEHHRVGIGAQAPFRARRLDTFEDEVAQRVDPPCQPGSITWCRTPR